MPGASGRGHRPCHSATLIPGQPGAQSPRPAPAPPSAGASRPPGRALAFVAPGPAGLRGTVSHGRGNAVRFLFPPAQTKALPPLQWQGPSSLPQRHADPWPAGGPKPPASARPALGGRFSPAGSGADLCWCGWHGSSWQRLARAGKRMRFLFPPGLGAEDQGPNHQPRRHGRGHCPCHSATLIPGPPGAQSPRPAPAPPSAGASRPPGRALAFVGVGGTGLGGSVPRGGGKRMRFLFPPGLGAEDQSPKHQPRCHGRGHRPCHSARLILGQPGA
jgi:hypothetical protein